MVGIIRDIADQTNLLALNATIEAARAGEMGKGFAVVASEVKELASQTSKATEEISNQIDGVQSLTENAVQAIGRITNTVGEINSVTTAIASAVEEQEASSQEIANSIQLASVDTKSAMTNAQGVVSVIEETANEAQVVETASAELTIVAKQLAKEVEEFLNSVAQDVNERRSSLRVKMNQAVAIQASGLRVATNIVDASEDGCRIEPAGDLRVGDKIMLELVDGKKVEARVAHCRDGSAGLQFAEKIESIGWLQAA